MTRNPAWTRAYRAQRSGRGLVAHPVFKTGRAGQPPAWKVRFLRRSVQVSPPQFAGNCLATPDVAKSRSPPKTGQDRLSRTCFVSESQKTSAAGGSAPRAMVAGIDNRRRSRGGRGPGTRALSSPLPLDDLAAASDNRPTRRRIERCAPQMAIVPAHTALPTSDAEVPVFSGGVRRGYWLRRGGLAAAALVVVWLLALIAGVLGFDSVPGLSLPALRGQPSAVFHRDREPLPTVGRFRASTAGGSGRAIVVAGYRAPSASPSSSRSAGPPAVRGRVAPQRRSSGSPSASPAPPSHGPAPAAPAAPIATAPTGHLGTSGAPPAKSNSHRADAPGQQAAPADPAPRSPRARANR
jgi:hypothetical protein